MRRLRFRPDAMDAMAIHAAVELLSDRTSDRMRGLRRYVR